jgi:hypothetical protein
MRHLAKVLFGFALLLAFPALAQEPPKPEEPECTREYVKKLEDRYRQNRKLRDWLTDPAGAGCRIAEFTEDIGGKAAEKSGLRKLWEMIPYSDRIDPRLTSKTCEYARSLVDNQISTAEDGERLRKEIKRCTGADVIN